jgi:O-antigen/teichoic acid export membrane protein
LRELAKNIITFGLAVAMERLLSFLLVPLYARVFTVEEFGAIDLIQTFVSITSIFAFLQLETSLQRYYYTCEGEERKRFVFTLVSTIVTISVILSICISCIHVRITSFFLDVEYAPIVLIALWQIPFSVLSTLTLIVLRFEKRNKLFFLIVAIKSVLLVSFIYFFLITKNLGIEGFFMAQLLAMGIASILSLILTWKDISASFVKRDIVKSFKYALPQFPARIGSTLNSYTNRFFMVGYLSTYSIGIFSMAQKFGMIMLLFHQVFMMAWNQYMFKIIEDANHKHIFKSVLKVVMPPIFFLSILIGLLAPEIISVFASVDYSDASKFIGAITLAISILISSEIINIGAKITLKTYYMSISFMISLLVNVACLFVFIQIFTLSGVLYALLITNITLISTNWFFSEKLYKVGFDIKHYCITFIPALLLSLIVMNCDFSFKIRLFLLFPIAAYYYFIFARSLSQYKKIL